MTYKKTLAHPKANEDQRRGFQSRIKAHEAAGRPIVYIDESGFATDMAANIFTAWVKRDLRVKRPENSLVAMDNATLHKRGDTQEAIKNAEHELLYLPPYSPDLNPIEKKRAQARAIGKQRRCSIRKFFKIKSFHVT